MITSCKDYVTSEDQFYTALFTNPDTILDKNISLLQEIESANFSWLSTANHDLVNGLENAEATSLSEYQIANEQLTSLVLSAVKYNFENVTKGNNLEQQKFILYQSRDFTAISDTEFSWLRKQVLNFKIEKPRDLFLSVKYGQLLAAKYYSRNSFEKSISILLETMHQLSEYDKGFNFLKTRDLIISDLLVLISRESEVKIYENIIRSMVNLLTNNYLESYDGVRLLSYMSEEGVVLKDIRSTAFYLEKAKRLAKTPRERLAIYWSLGLQSDSASSVSHVPFYEQALQQFSDTCRLEYFQVLLYILSSDLSRSQREFYWRLYNRKDKCSIEVNRILDLLGPNYLDLTLFDMEGTEVLDFLSKGRKLAHELFPGKSTLHLQDLYANNYQSIFHTVYGDNPLAKSEASTVVNTCLDTRERDIYRLQLQSESDGVDIEKYSRINELLLELDEFRSYFPQKKEKYRELFDLYLSIDDNGAPFENVSVDLMVIKSKLENSHQILVNIFKGVEEYLVYKIDGQDFSQYTLPVRLVDSIGSIEYENISSHKGFPTYALQSYLTKLEISGDKEVVLITDGVFSALPAELYLAGNQKVQIIPTLRHYLDKERIDINSSKSMIYSYSDKVSISSKEVRQYPELPIGLSERDSIINIIRSEPVLSADSELLNSSNDLDLLHLSTHAFSSTSNRMDNYFLKRSDQSIDKVYGFKLYEKSNLPEVVVLSACESGFGMHAYGAGVQTLSRAFLDNGTQTVVKTLWKVNEKATAEFMTNFYRKWSSGLSMGESLYITKSELKDNGNYSHPYYWAGFVLEGNPNIYLEK